MRRTVLNSLVVLSLTALTAVAIGCATAPVDEDLSGLTQDQTPAEPEESASAKLPPATNPSKELTTPTDAGADAKTAAKDSGSTPTDSGSTPVDSGGATGGDCDPNDPTYYIKFVTASNPGMCPCSASECCYLSIGCVAK